MGLWAKIEVSLGCIPYGGSSGESTSLSFFSCWKPPAFLGSWPFLPSSKQAA